MPSCSKENFSKDQLFSAYTSERILFMKSPIYFNRFTDYIFILINVILFIFLLLTKNYYVAVVQTAFMLACMIYNFINMILWKKYMFRSINKFLEDLGDTKQNLINSLKLPIIMVDGDGEVIWYNSVFRANVLLNADIFGKNIKVVIENFEANMLNDEAKVTTKYKNKIYDVYTSLSKNKSEQDKKTYIMFFIDATRRKELEIQVYENQPVVIMVSIDNYEDILNNVRASEKNKIINDVEVIINDYFGSGNNGIVRKLEKDLFIVVQERKYVLSMIENKFNILNKVRDISENVTTPITLSIGVGLDSFNINESERFAKQSLDMALGRGGDQVAIKRNDNFEFFGGLSSGQVNSVKVKTRIVATSLVELINESDNVVIMGHRFADLDCFGAAIGMAKGVKLINDEKDVYIIIDKEKNLAESLYESIKGTYLDEILISPSEIGDYINKNTLLIILDTHIKSFLESLEAYQSCKQVIVIDHHRKVVDHISDAVIFYHEPSASSTCEMVTELLQYFSNRETISSLEANALLSGIMLDTRNFVLKTGVRTFEAAAYLKKHGASTVEVKKMFSSSMEAYQKKTKLVSMAQIYKKCAITVAESKNEDLRVIAAQAANELLTINDVDASFVLYEYDNKIMVSARSMGAVNVQVIMEYLGGGGHLSMAGAQFSGSTLKNVTQDIKRSIDKYYSE